MPRVSVLNTIRRLSRKRRRGRAWRSQVLKALTTWNRNQAGRIVFFTFLTWLVGAAGMYLLEGGSNADYASVPDSLWNAWLLLFAGPDEPPKTWAGRLLVMAMLGVGIGLVGLFTASVASILIERHLRRRELTATAMENHIVLCNWAPRGLEWIRQVHSRIVEDWRPIVIIHDETDQIDLPDKSEEPAFSEVFLVRGDSTSEVILRRAGVPKAYSVVVLLDPREGKHADGKTILTCLTIRNLCKGDERPNIIAECLSPDNRPQLRKAGADEIVSATDIGLRLLARATLFHGMIRVYQELLTIRRDNNEIYSAPVPEALLGKTFEDLTVAFAGAQRGGSRGCVLIGIQRDEEMMINPVGDEAGPIRPGDQLILLSRVNPKLDELFPA